MAKLHAEKEARRELIARDRQTQNARIDRICEQDSEKNIVISRRSYYTIVNTHSKKCIEQGASAMQYDERALELIRALSDAPGASGFEDAVLSVVREAMGDRFVIEEDALRNLYLYRRRNTGDRPVIMLDAHSDEVGFMVHSIRPNGTLRVVNLGRWTNSALPSSKVLVRNAEGRYIPGVFVSKPAHFSTAADKVGGEVPISALSVDIGATSAGEAAEVFHIRMGEPIVPATRFELDREHGLMFGKAFDCRLGCAAMLEVLRRVDGLDLPCDVVGVLSSQEEVGERGCRVSVSHVKPDLAICFEGCPADDTFTEPYAIQTALHKGPMFRHMDVSVICSPRLQRFVLDTAHEGGFAVQESVREGGGNDAAIINTALLGIPAVTAGVPVRYIHSMNCIASYRDYEATAALITELVRRITPEMIGTL